MVKAHLYVENNYLLSLLLGTVISSYYSLLLFPLIISSYYIFLLFLLISSSYYFLLLFWMPDTPETRIWDGEKTAAVHQL